MNMKSLTPVQVQLAPRAAKALMGLALLPLLSLPFNTPVNAETLNYPCSSSQFKQIIQSGARSVGVFQRPFTVNPQVIGEIYGDQVVVVLSTDRSGFFAEIETAQNQKGWIYASKLHPLPGLVKSLNTRVNLRTEPQLQARIIDRLTTGNIVRYRRTVGQWVYVTDNRGQSGYIANTYLVCTTARFN
jgi:hypothetical protein